MLEQHYDEVDRLGYVWGLEEDLYWRCLGDELALKDMVPASYLDLHQQCYDA